MSGAGWIGATKDLLAALRAAGADRAPDGGFAVYGAPVTFGLGGAEAVVPAGAEVTIAGERVRLAQLLTARGLGLAITVI